MTDEKLTRLHIRCVGDGIEIKDFNGELAISEADAEKIFRYKKDALAAQARNGTNFLEYKVRGNRRFYFLSNIIKHL